MSSHQLTDADSSLPSNNLLQFSCSELESIAVQMGDRPYRGRQLFRNIFVHGKTCFRDMTDLPLAFRQAMEKDFHVLLPHIDRVLVSADGVRKYRFSTQTGVFESVFIPEVAKSKHTHALCISSQTGCALGCAFCVTAQMPHPKNLSAAEIIGQVLAVMHDVRQQDNDAHLRNIVFMGMGEPLFNYEQVLRATRIFTESLGLNFSSRHITISTAGVVPKIVQLGHEIPVQLAVSLNATTNEVRDKIMPINRRWPLESLLQALRDYPLPRRRRITIEYVLLKGINDSMEDAKRLSKLLAHIPVKINLLPYNENPHTSLKTPSRENIERFQKILMRSGLHANIRTPRGGDIAAACGQLGGSDQGT